MNKISLSNSDDNIELILNYLSDFSKIPTLKSVEELQEYKLDVFSEKFYANLLHNFLYFYTINGAKKVNSAEHKYLIKESVIALNIIYEDFPDTFLDDDFLKSLLIYLVYSLKETPIISTETVLKIFFGIYEVFPFNPLDINKIIKGEVTKFEKENIETIIKLKNKFVEDFQIEVKFNSENDFSKIIVCLKRKMKSLPLYLKGFINYSKLSEPEKFLIIKIYNYFKIINPFNKDDLFFDMYQGYIIYEIILNKENAPIINFENFKKIRENRIKNNEAKSILEIAIQLLEKRYSVNFNNELNEINFDLEYDNPKIADIFCDTENYYKDLFKQLRFYLTQYKTSKNKKPCLIVNNNISRVLWLNFSKILLLNLSEEHIKQDNIKIIFYSLVHLFNPDIPTDSLEFCEDVIPKFFAQCPSFLGLLDYKEIYAILDDYKYYPHFSRENTFTQTFINFLNKEILENDKLKELQNKQSINLEMTHIKKCDKNIPFPLLQDYLCTLNDEEDYSENTANNYFKRNLYRFYKICWPFFDDMKDSDEEIYFKNLRKIISAKVSNYFKEIKTIINDQSFLDLIYQIMSSPVMKDAYNRIYYWYSTNGEYDLDKETIDDDMNKVENFNKKSNLINGNPIIDYYNKFCESLKNQGTSGINNPNLFIIMGLPSSIKGFTFRFLKIVINSEGIEFPSKVNKEIDVESKNTLLRAYLVFVIIHEQNHFMKRYFNKNQPNILCKTPVIKNISEGGRQLIKLLFGDELIKKKLNIEQANFILNINNWNKKSVSEFKKCFKEIKTGNHGDKCIVYLSSPDESICDHSKLHA